MARFEREARNAVRLKSDHVAKITDVGRIDDGVPYMVMEYLEGKDLDAVLEERGPLPVPVAVDFLLQACEAVAEAHALGIVHRDLKPKNLFLAAKHGGRSIVKVLDFGISKQLGVAEDMSLTSTAQVMGSPNYMSPEQLRASKDVDHRTDIWALGAILFQLLTGQVPFPAGTVTQLTAMVIADPPQSIRELRGDIPEELHAVVLRCLAKKRDERFASVSELVMALTPFASEQGASAAQAILGIQGSPSASSAKSIPFERPSLRAAGGSTSVAWDKTQVAEVVVPKRSMARLAVIAGATFAALALGGFFALRGRPAASTHTASLSPTTPAASNVGNLAGLPTARDPRTPLVSPTGGPDRPVPPPFASGGPTTAVARATTLAASAGTAAVPRDAGAIVLPPPPNPAVTTTASSTGQDPNFLPSTRN